MPLNVGVGKLAVSSARLPFAEQIDFFKAKLGKQVLTERWTDMMREQHDVAFMVAGAAKADLLADLAAAVDVAITKGTGIEAFRKDFDSIVGRHGWDYRGERNWRTRVIFQTNLTSSYAAGRLKQLRDPDLLRIKPFWMYRHSDGVLNPRPLHVSWNGLVLPADDQWFRAHYPPNDFGCMCYVVAVSERDAMRLNGRIVDQGPDDGTDPDGQPSGIGKGWDYMPGATTVERSIEAKAENLPEALRQDLLADIARVKARRGRP